MAMSVARPFLILSALLIAASAQAQDTAPPADLTLSGSASIVSQYRFRGISQSDQKPAVQAAITLNHLSGFYLTGWGSSAGAGGSAVVIGGSEFDLTGGYARELGTSGITADLGVTGYFYPGASDGNYGEVYASLAKSYGPATAKLGVNYAPPQKVFTVLGALTRHNVYLYGELSSGIPGTPISLHGHLGHTAGGFDWTRAYLDYTLGATARWRALSLDLSLTGTNVSRADALRAPIAPSAAETLRAAKTALVATLSASF